jgi:flagellar biosynthesis protein FlhB
MSDRTEEPTPRRLRRAREEGDAGVSVYGAQAVSFTVAVALVPALVGTTVTAATSGLRRAIALAAAPTPRPALDATALARTVVVVVAPFLLAVATTSAVAQAVQAGGVLATSRLAPRLERLDPVSGLRNLVSPARLFAVARSTATAAIVAALVVVGVRDHLMDLARTAGRVAPAGAVVGAVMSVLGWRVALFGLAVGAIDLLVTRRAWLRRLRMTKDEVKREHRDAEGDPQLKAARERAHHEIFAQAAVARVRHASVVVVNPTHLACALRYEPERDAAPVVVASGEGDVAARIVRAARDFSVPVVQDVPLAHALAPVEIGDAIPEALYEATAAVLGAIADRTERGAS